MPRTNLLKNIDPKVVAQKLADADNGRLPIHSANYAPPK